jgi:uncharacterized OB-fold protein
MAAPHPYRPLPHLSDLNRPYYEAARRHQLVAQHCRDCGNWFAPADAACTRCFSTNWSWQQSSGRGRIYSFSAMHRVLPGFPSPTFYAVVELEEGFAMFTNIVDCKEADLECELPVEVSFDDITDELSLPVFRLTRAH